MIPEAIASQAAAPASRTYLGWQQEKVAFLFGLSAQRAVMIAAAVLAAIIPVTAARPAEGAITWPLAALLLAAAFIRTGGRTAGEWLAAAVSYQLLALRGQHKFASGPFVLQASSTPSAAAPGQGPPMDLPGILAPLRILAVPTGPGREMAVAHHRYDRTYTAVARIGIPGIGLTDSARRDQRVAGWGALLAGLCTEGNPIIRVQAFQRIVPESGAALRRWHDDHLAPGAPPAATQITSELLATSTLATCQREAYLAFVMDERRAGAAIRGAGGGPHGAATVLARHVRALSAAIGGAELRIEGWLGSRDLAEVIRTAFDPHALAPLAERRAAAVAAVTSGRSPNGLPPGITPALAGPAAAEARPGMYLHDGAVSVSYWVHSWPRSQVYCTALAPLLGDGLHRRSFGMVIEPLSPRAAEREVMRERTARHVAVRMRQRTGQIVPEHEQAAMDRAHAQDAERAAGHGLVRFTGYATVTVTSPAELDDACAALEADAAAARTEIRRMWFAQDAGFAMGALPLGFGLPRRRWLACPAATPAPRWSLTWPSISALPPFLSSRPRTATLGKRLSYGAQTGVAATSFRRSVGGPPGAGDGRPACLPRRCSAAPPGRYRACTRGCTGRRCHRRAPTSGWTAWPAGRFPVIRSNGCAVG